jgi:hypothetical protein
MNRLGNYRYAGTSDPMGEREAYHCERYIRRNRAVLYPAERFLIDVPALLTPFHLDCTHCREVHRETCCENGQPYAVDAWQIPLLEREAPAIMERFLAEGEWERYEQSGIWDRRGSAGTIRLRHGNCLFHTEIDGRPACAIHAYAEQTGGDPYSLKPISCQLYPLDLIDTGEHVLITALTEETAPFSRWGRDYLDRFYCASADRRRQAKHIDPSLFALEGYRPAFQWGIPILRHVLGAAAGEAEQVLREKWLEESD